MQWLQHPRNRVKFIFGLAALTVVLLLPPLVLEARLYAAVKAVGSSDAASRTVALDAALASEEESVLKILRTAGNPTLSNFERQKDFVLAQQATDDAISALAPQQELADLLAALTVRLGEVRRMALRDLAVTAGDVTSRFADVRRIVSVLSLIVQVSVAPPAAGHYARASAFSSMAAQLAVGGGEVVAAFTQPGKAFASLAKVQTALAALTDFEHTLRSAAALPGADVDTVRADRVVATSGGLSVAALRRKAQISLVAYSNTTQVVPTSLIQPASAFHAAFREAQRTSATSKPKAPVELAQLVINCLAITSAFAAAMCVVYVLGSQRLLFDSGAGREASIEHMRAAYKRVVDLMERIMTFDCTDCTDVAAGPALSVVEAELRSLLRPVATVVAHVPRAALVPNHHLQDAGAAADESEGAMLLRQLTSPPDVRHNVTVLFIDVHFLNGVAYSGDALKALPGRAHRLRSAIVSEVLKRGGLPVMSALNTWSFAWNLHGADKSGIQSATQCAMQVLGAASVDYPTMRAAVLTGSVAMGTAGSPTCKLHVLAGAPVLLAPVALRVARAHNAGLIVDSETHVNCAAHTYRSRAVEVAAADASGPSTVLYNMLSALDSHDQRLLQWNEAFEKYHSGRVHEALLGFRAWAKEGSDATVQRLISLLEMTPPRLVTVADTPASVFAVAH